MCGLEHGHEQRVVGPLFAHSGRWLGMEWEDTIDQATGRRSYKITREPDPQYAADKKREQRTA